MATAVQLRNDYYDNGEFDRCLEAVGQELAVCAQGDPEIGELHALGGWCHYRKGEYETAREWFVAAGPVTFAREGLLYLAAYRDKDDMLIQELANELGDLVNVQNALVIRARDADSTIPHSEVVLAVSRFTESMVEVANLCHNAGRFFLAKPQDSSDLVLALGFLDMAKVRYGIDRNWHHRGALHFWRSCVFEQLLDKQGALEAARDSYFCWAEQCILDPETPRHREQLENAYQRILKLLGQL
ncbi:MAG: hypothetical protein O3C23_00360 [bacterium]|nr:hypothetical protein [bacterium]